MSPEAAKPGQLFAGGAQLERVRRRQLLLSASSYCAQRSWTSHSRLTTHDSRLTTHDSSMLPQLQLRDRRPVYLVRPISEAQRPLVRPRLRQEEVVGDAGRAVRLDGA